MKARRAEILGMTAVFVAALLVSTVSAQESDSSRNVLKQGLLGAGTGAIAASASGGDAGKGALIGAGTNVIGSALLDALTGPPQQSTTTYRRAAPPQQDDYYYADDPSEEYYVVEEEPAPQQSQSSQILKQGLLGAGTGAIAASASGGDAGKGALIGAGTNVIGNALLDTLTQPTQQRQRKVYRKIPRQQQAPQAYQQAPRQNAAQQNITQETVDAGVEGGRKKIIRKYDENGKVVSEEEIYY